MLLSARIICTLNERLGLEKQHYIKQRFWSSQTWHWMLQLEGTFKTSP
jgi:hypothetical protein